MCLREREGGFSEDVGAFEGPMSPTEYLQEGEMHGQLCVDVTEYVNGIHTHTHTHTNAHLQQGTESGAVYGRH